MAVRRAKQTAATLAVVPPPAPAPSRPPHGYDAATVAEAAEILRHQTVVLGVRARVAGAAGGLAPLALAVPERVPAPPGAPEQDFEPVLAALREVVERLEEREAAARRHETELAEARVEQTAAALADLRAQLDMRSHALERDAAAVADREAAARRRETELAEARAALDADVAKLRPRKDELDTRAKELDRTGSTHQKHAAELAKRARKLAADEQALRTAQTRLTDRERDLERRDAEIGRRDDELRRAEKELRKAREALEKTQRRIAAAAQTQPPPAVAPPEPAHPVAAAPAVTPEPPAPAAAGPATQNVETLAALVTRYAGEFPEQVEEWRWYLQSLRDVADISGGLPASVDGLVHDVFGPLLARAVRG